MYLKDKIPSHFHQIFVDLLEIEIPYEKIATCKECTLCVHEKSPYQKIKCCNYYPRVANFLVGGIIQDENLKFGKEIIENLIEKKIGVSPFGIFPDLLYTKRKNAFTERISINHVKKDIIPLICPFMKNEMCTVWDYRENLCVTYFCSSISGKFGVQFWEELNSFIRISEIKISKYCMKKLRYKEDDISLFYKEVNNFDLQNKNGTLNKKKYNKIWNNWLLKEMEYYSKCYEIYKDLEYNEFKKIFGKDYLVVLNSLKLKSKEFLKNVFPEKVIINSKATLKIDKNTVTFFLGSSQLVLDHSSYFFFKLFNGINNTIDVEKKALSFFLSINNYIEDALNKNILLNANTLITE
ncbi:MAG: hypothetical protein HYU67_12360 [Flavobacteriia bacterium]|nr:hypothetical protein [Flavobacteriia bacterium]